MSVLVVQEPQSFLQEKIQLQKLLKELNKASKDAVDVLVGLLRSNDEKVRMQAARMLLDLQKDVADKINQDNFQRMIAETKFVKGANGNLVPIGAEKPKRPVVDFNSIRSLD